MRQYLQDLRSWATYLFGEMSEYSFVGKLLLGSLMFVTGAILLTFFTLFDLILLKRRPK